MGETGKVETTKRKTRGQSSIAYPYYNLEVSLEVARAIHEQGGGECSAGHLASFLGYKSPRSGTYLTRVSSAKLFGFVEGSSLALKSTERALTILNPIMPEDSIKEKTDAFLGVPLFHEIYERFKNSTLPGEPGLKNLLSSVFGVVPDRVNPATRVFYESADQAGFFNASPDRRQLLPPLSHTSRPTSSRADVGEVNVVADGPIVTPRTATANPDSPGGIHSALAGLLRELPQPGPWDAEKKKQFLGAFTAIFDFIYPSKEEKVVESKFAE